MVARWDQDLYLRTYKFAAQAHRWQKVPGTRLPYIAHLTWVSMELMAAIAAGEVEERDLALQCALLHDTLEDTFTKYEKLVEEFGKEVAQGVLALTVNKKLPKQERMPDSLKRIREQQREIWMVKLADRITNLQRPPRHWSKGRIREYLGESRLIQHELHAASPFLSERLRVKIGEYVQFGT
jgi:(p)ppGpp synthase/HD superfamily hydrolase